MSTLYIRRCWQAMPSGVFYDSYDLAKMSDTQEPKPASVLKDKEDPDASYLLTPQQIWIVPNQGPNLVNSR